jgi:hypothetical protein
MAILRPETVKLIAQEMYDYQLSDRRAKSIADGTGPLATLSSQLPTILRLDSVEPPFGYPNLEAEAARIRGAKRED